MTRQLSHTISTNKHTTKTKSFDYYELNYYESLKNELQKFNFVEKLKDINQLGATKVQKNKVKSRYDYVIFQLYIHNEIQINVDSHYLEFAYSNQVKEFEFKNANLQFATIPTIADCIQILILAYNIGHFSNTFTSSLALTESANGNANIKNWLISSLDSYDKTIANSIIDDMDYTRFHLINSLIILNKCDDIDSVKLAKELIRAYIIGTDSKKINYIFKIFRKVRSLCYITFDLPISNNLISFSVHNKNSVTSFLKEYFSAFNNDQNLYSLFSSVNKILEDEIYDSSENALCLYKISRKIKKSIKELDINTTSYFDLLSSSQSIVNRNYSKRIDFDKTNILHITFCETDNVDVFKLHKRLSKMNNVRTSFYIKYRFKNNQRLKYYTFIVALSKKCVDKTYISFKVLKTFISILYNKISLSDSRYISITKFFLHYLLDGKELIIDYTINDDHCIIVKKGVKSQEKLLDKYIRESNSSADAIHETDFIKTVISKNKINSTAMIVFGSIKTLKKGSSKSSRINEYDGIIIYPFTDIVIFTEAKNMSKGNDAKKDLDRKLNNIGIKYNKEEHMPESHHYYYLENKMNAESYKSWAKSYGPNVYELICMVIGTFRYEEQSYKSCNGILHLCKNNPKVFSDTAAKTCLESHIYNYTHFKKQLYNLMNQKKTNSSGTLPEHKNIRGKSHYE